MTKEEYIDRLQEDVTQKDLDEGEYAWVDAIFMLRDIINAYCQEFNDEVPQKMFKPFITEYEAAQLAQKYLDDNNLSKLRRFLVGSRLYDGIYKLDKYNELEDTSEEEMFEVRDKIIQHIKDSDK